MFRSGWGSVADGAYRLRGKVRWVGDVGPDELDDTEEDV